MDTRNVTKWRHSKPGKETKWEDLLVAAHGEHWIEKANGNAWPGLRDKTVEMAYSAYGREVPERQYGKAK